MEVGDIYTDICIDIRALVMICMLFYVCDQV